MIRRIPIVLILTLLFALAPVFQAATAAADEKAMPASTPSPASTPVKPVTDAGKTAVPGTEFTGTDVTKTPVPKDSKIAETVDTEAFDTGYRLFSKNRFEEAAPQFYRYVSRNTVAADDYEWAEFFLGVCLKKTGFTHAAVDTLSRLITRKPNVQIVNYSLEIFEDISKTQPFDRDIVILKSVCDQDYEFVDPKLNDFINYHQGVFDWENGFEEWGRQHFEKIRKETYYYYDFLFQKALYAISRNDIDGAVALLTTINGADFKGEDLKNDVRKTLARLLYEKKDYAKADEMYRSITDNIVYQAENLLERSWAQYRMKKPEKAMGLLYAFKAPVYSNYFTPEYFLLKSFIYKDVCHYQRALSVIDEFRDHYRTSLDTIYTRGDLTGNHPLLLALLGQKKVDDAWKFLRLIDDERARVATVKDPELKARLDAIYALEMEKVSRDFRLLMKDRYEILANDLLEYEEKTNLMAYEIGLDMYQRIYQYHFNEDKAKEKDAVKKRVEKHYYAVFPFQGEFWTDELDRYKVVLEDKCACMEEWDIFFK
jgi:hypothetical protein